MKSLNYEGKKSFLFYQRILKLKSYYYRLRPFTHNKKICSDKHEKGV